MIKELVTTGLQETRPENIKEAVFLGPWCLMPEDQVADLSIEKNHWTIEKAQKAFVYISNLTDKVFESLSDKLNDYYSQKFSNRFWQIALGKHVQTILDILYDHYLSLKQVDSSGIKYYVYADLSEKLSFNRTENLVSNVNSHILHYFFYSEILKNVQFKNIQVREKNIKSVSSLDSDILIKKEKLIHKLLSFSRVKLGYIPGVRLKDRLIILFKSNCLFSLKTMTRNWGEISPKNTKALQANSNLGIKVDNEFESIVNSILLRLLPDKILKRIPRNLFSERVKLWIGNDPVSGDDHACKVARVVENGGRWISAQHGGCYGHNKIFREAKLEYDYSDGFISWGWKEHQHFSAENITVKPSPYISQIAKHKGGTRILLISNATPRYFFKLSNLIAGDRADYYKDQITFVNKLQNSIKEKIEYRPYRTDFGAGTTCSVSRILNKSIFNGNLMDGIQNSKLVILDHLSTSLLETLSIDTPTLVFYDTEHFPVLESVEEDFNALKKVGILYHCPIKAAEFLNKNYNSISDWWNKEHVQKARKEFVMKYALASKEWRNDWSLFIKDELKK
ncbi:MAG: LIC12162 family protein [Lentisphaeraceae bacterium]|nr:LIC12162 family protein [Lentisphaeraceae bacterium]